MRSRCVWALVAYAFAAPALAADLGGSLKDPIPVYVPPPITWTGCYLGTDGGYKWGRNKVTTPTTYNLNNTAVDRATNLDVPRALVTTRNGGFSTTDGNGTAHSDGGFWGGEVGCNYDTHTGVVVGIDISGTWDFAKDTYTEELTRTNGAHITNLTTEIDRQCQFRAGPKLGATLPGFGTNLDGLAPLVYVTGGYAATCYKVTQTSDNAAFRRLTANPDVSDSKFESGWFAGVGVDIPTSFLLPSTFVQIEYTHADYGSTSYSLAGSDVTRTIDNTTNEVRVGFKYKFPVPGTPPPEVPR